MFGGMEEGISARLRDVQEASSEETAGRVVREGGISRREGNTLVNKKQGGENNDEPRR